MFAWYHVGVQRLNQTLIELLNLLTHTGPWLYRYGLLGKNHMYIYVPSHAYGHHLCDLPCYRHT
jgi:hypothetical protein